MFEDIFVQFGPGYSSVELNNAPLIISSHEPLGIKSAVHNLALDFGRVLTKRLKQTVVEADTDLPKLEVDTAIIIGCLESSHLVQDMVSKGKLDVESISGRWESFCTSVVAKPFEGIAKALVIVGSDKRGTIYGAYTLSEQIGVSPWYWWADVPPKQHSAIYAIDKSTCHGEPSIKYRGIFLNDEAPVLTGWVLEKFGKYNSQFYEKVFELILRLKANFLWPAMWPGYPNPGASFFTDDSRNQALADELGIVISTSHHEPMQRLSNEWFAENPDGSWNWLTNKDRITDFFREGVQRAAGKESYFTLGMRGELCTKVKRQHSNPIAGNMGVAVEGHEGVRPGRCNEESDRTHPSRRDLVPGVTFQALSRYSTKNRWFEIYTRGPRTIHWYVTTPKEWLKFSNGDGMLGPDDDDVRIEINVDWDLVPDTFEEEILIDVKSKEGDFEQLHLPITARKVPKTITPGFIEADGYVSIPATASQIHPPYRVLLDTGRLPTGSISLDTSTHIQGDDLPFLTYTFYNFTVVKEATLIIYFGTTLILSPDETLQYDLQVDDGPVATHDLYSVSAEAIQKSKDEGWPAADGWFEAAGDNVWVNRHIISGEVLTPGRHDLRFRLRHSNMLLEKLVLDLGGVGESYLGPLASLFLAQQ
ncbi:glycoside hydrolase family 115 protein [Pseudocercospora fijiensis CIRAD86]|uniref:Glycoside hydrolase family 115 protein n=1 Tax=Pseudocercospora fijiensis (strain CIRAD86) TaxID=383855 RepID=M2ZTR1_PSEFD|nr:glycoside hydrolase family 115 protein [Pseudocercospora fijiensis CIRAD86]EME82394.1 glycoside hydrolase family 115 protein [Pseudocercospora fijiensis CIRAD86]